MGLFFFLYIYIKNTTMNFRKIILEEIRLSLFEGLEHMQNLYKSWANKKSGNPEAALKIMDDVLNHQKRLPKKDFSKYSSYKELLSDLNKIKQSLKSEDVTKFYEDSELVVLAANTWESSCKYGAGSKWCTTAKDTDSYWARHNETGTEFFWIFKKKPQSDPDHKFSYHIKSDGNAPDWCNAINNCRKNISPSSYPKQHPKYEEIINKLQEFHKSRDFQRHKPMYGGVSMYEENKEVIDDALMVYISEFIENDTKYFSEALKNNFDNELEYAIKWQGGTTLLMRVLKLSRISVRTTLKDTDNIINNRIKEFIQNKFKNEDLSKYINLELFKERTTRDLRFVVFRLLTRGGFEANFSPILPQLEERGLTIEDIISGLPNREFKESINENIEYTDNGFIDLLNTEIYKFVEDNIDEFKKLLK